MKEKVGCISIESLHAQKLYQYSIAIDRRSTTNNHIQRETLRSTRYIASTTNSRAINETVSIFEFILFVLQIIYFYSFM